MKNIILRYLALLLVLLVLFLCLLAGVLSLLLSWSLWLLAVIGLDRERRSLLKELSVTEEDEHYFDMSFVGPSLDREIMLGARFEDVNRRIAHSRIPGWRQNLRKISQRCILSFS